MMLNIEILNRLLSSFQSSKHEDDLLEALIVATNILGFTRFAMGHHVDLSAPPQDAIRLTNYNRDWIAHGLDRGYFSDDPIHVASTKRVSGFLWSEVGKIIRLSARQKQVMSEATGFGLAAGFTVPIHLPGEFHGTCSFAAPSLDRLPDNALPMAQLCGTFAFEAARRIMRRKLKLGDVEMPDLTPRQLDALILVGRGKTDAEIASILGVSKATAHEHVERVRHAYGNAQRAFLIVRALFDGQISFADLLRR